MSTKTKERLKRNFRYEGKVYTVYGYSDRELTRKETEKRAALERNEIIIESTMTVAAWAEQFINTYKVNTMRDYVFDNYKYQMRHYILEEIGHMQLKKVKPLHCQSILNGLDGKSASLIHKVYTMLNELFEKAAQNRLITDNPARAITQPKGTKKTRRALTAREEAAFLAAAKKHPHGLLYMLMWGCGCRPSEAEKVEGRDIQSIDGKLYLHIRGTKTKNSDRFVPIPPEVQQMIPARPEPFKPLVRTSEGNAISPRRQRGSWQAMERLMNIELGCRTYRNQLLPPYPLADDLCSYCLRHTFCTNLQKRGIDIRMAQKLMGHSDIRMTANVYSHTGLEEIGAAFDQITGADAYIEAHERTSSSPERKLVMIS